MKLSRNKRKSHRERNICLHCGSEVDGDICKCCGSVCKDVGNIRVKFEDKAHLGELTIQGNTYQVYLGEAEIHSLVTCDGSAVVKHKFTMIEV